MLFRSDLLLPAVQRPTTFSVGGIEFDPVRVGFKSGPGDGPFVFNVKAADGTLIPGNSNAGHEYGTGLTSDERAALLEYLKMPFHDLQERLANRVWNI